MAYLQALGAKMSLMRSTHPNTSQKIVRTMIYRIKGLTGLLLA